MTRPLQHRDVSGPIERACRRFLNDHEIPSIHLGELTAPLLDEIHDLMERYGQECYEAGKADAAKETT